MRDFKLYCFGESGNSYKAALMLQFCELEWDAINAWLERIKATDGWKAPYDLMPAGLPTKA